MGRDCSLPLLPTGVSVFESLPFGAVVLDVLAPAVENGLITIRDGESSGVLVIRDGAVADTVWVAECTRHHGNEALALIRNSAAATVSACRMNDEVMSLLGPLIRSEPSYSDLRLEWVGWPEFLEDFRRRGGTFVVEVRTPSDRGVTVIQHGHQIATYAESHPALGDADLLDALAAGRIGTVRVLVDHGLDGSHIASDVVRISDDPFPPDAVRTTADPYPQEVARTSADPYPPVVACAPEPISMQPDDPSATLSALFGPPRALAHRPSPLSAQPSQRDSSAQVETVLPELMLLVRDRMQRSSGSVEDIVNNAAQDHKSVDWLAERVRATMVRGFTQSTFDHLADEMLSVRPRHTD